jgi:signal peptidase I
MSYHFVKPSVGSGFVFRTDNIHSYHMTDRQSGRQVKSYYIKRLVGMPGDTLEIRNGVLIRNGEPITGADAFDKNARKEGLYRGYAAQFSLADGKSVEISAKGYYAMGDNSYDSADSRYWGEVPYKDVVGRPLFIYYPFTKRWGPAR